jgi:Uma2 family endonuclease
LSIFKRIIDEKHLGTLIIAPFDVILDDRNIVQPDLLFVSNRNLSLIRSEGIFGSPDLVVEILSPSSIVQDRYTKRSLYERFKVPEYWIVDWMNAAIEVLALSASGYELFSSAAGSGKIASKVIPDLEVDVAEVMALKGR